MSKSTSTELQTKAKNSTTVQTGILQRKCACGTHTIAGDKCDECQTKQGELQRKSSENSELAEAPPIVHEVLQSSGQPLDESARVFFESRFAHEFSKVPVSAVASRVSHSSLTVGKSNDLYEQEADRVADSIMRKNLSAKERHGAKPDLSRVRVHTDAKAAQSAKTVNALAYTVGNNIVFGAGKFAPRTNKGQQLIAHELTHVMQQTGLGGSSPASLRVSRFCTPAATCAPGTVIPGSAEDFGNSEGAIEARHRARRKGMSSGRSVSTGHAGRALQLERFLAGQNPTRLANIHGIFIDQDLSSGTGALTMSCDRWVSDSLPAGAPTPPGMVGAVKDCTFVHGNLNQEALIFNTSTAPIIGGLTRERWRIDTLQILTHETEHPRFEAATAGAPLPPGVTSPSCSRTNVLSEISEIAAGLSEFTVISRPASAEANPAGPLHTRMRQWFHEIAVTGGENFRGALMKMGCRCNCSEVDAHVRATFAEVTASNGWSVAERNAFNTQMRLELPVGSRPSWPL